MGICRAVPDEVLARATIELIDMNIAAGLSGLKAAADITKMPREGIKAGSIKGDEIAGRIGEIYDYIIDSKAALVDAKEENEALKAVLKSLKDTQSLAASLEHDGKVYWIARGEKGMAPSALDAGTINKSWFDSTTRERESQTLGMLRFGVTSIRTKSRLKKGLLSLPSNRH